MEEPSARMVRGQGEKILVVDDDEEILEPMKDLLGSMGYRPMSSSSAEEALTLFRSWRPDAVLLDRNMPRMDGLTCAQEMTAMDPGARIIISGYDEDGPQGVDDSRKPMIRGYLTKPIDPVRLSELLSQVLKQGGA